MTTATTPPAPAKPSFWQKAKAWAINAVERCGRAFVASFIGQLTIIGGLTHLSDLRIAAVAGVSAAISVAFSLVSTLIPDGASASLIPNSLIERILGVVTTFIGGKGNEPPPDTPTTTEPAAK